MASEEEKVIKAENSNEIITAFCSIPYALINAEIDGATEDTIKEFTDICKLYNVYRKGAKFTTEGANGDYIPADLQYKMAASLINKEARFLFAESPDIKIEPKGNLGKTTEEAKNSITVLQDLLKSILDKNMFEGALLKAAKDCFIGKRVAAVVNFNEEDGVTITFLKSTEFVYETKIGNPNVYTKFVAFITVKDSISTTKKRIFKKKYTLGDDGFVYLEEEMYDGAGSLLETVTEYQPTKLKVIPAIVFTNDGLTGEAQGESEIEVLLGFDSWYSKLSNSDIDAQRKSMNPTKYLVDMESGSTKNLSTAAGALWDLGSDQNLDNPHPSVGLLEPNMSYSSPLKTTLDRVKTTAYEQVDMPNITLESMVGSITSGKSLKAIYWGLIVRCKEKMKMWGPKLGAMVDIIIAGSLAYPNCVTRYTNDTIAPVDYEVSVEQNTPLPEDEIEEKNMDLSEVESNVMSKKSYMKKWRNLTDDEVDEELQQIALERTIIEDSSFAPTGSNDDTPPYPDVNSNKEIDDGMDVYDESVEDIQK